MSALLGQDPRIADLLEALGVPIRGQRVKAVTIHAEVGEPVTITVRRFADLETIQSAVESVDSYEIRAFPA